MNDLLEKPGMEQVSKKESARKWTLVYLENVQLHMDDRSGTLHENTFYLNSSDSLESLLKLQLQGEKVLTVSGSGEFSHAFIQAGAREVCNFDISPAACFYTELRHLALCELEMSDYITLFGSWIIPDDDDDSIRENIGYLINIEVYKKVAGLLSDEARTFFDLLQTMPSLFTVRSRTGNKFARTRWNKKTKNNRLIGDLVKSEAEYQELSRKAKAVTFSSVKGDAFRVQELVQTEHPDIVYFSNIGYYSDRIIELASSYLALGVPKVICTISSNDVAFNDRGEENYDDHTHFYFLGEKTEVGKVFEHELVNKNSQHEIVQIEVLGTDKNADYGLTLAITNRRVFE